MLTADPRLRTVLAWSVSALLVAAVFGPLCPVLGACPMEAAEASHCATAGMGGMAGSHEGAGMGPAAAGSETSHDCCPGAEKPESPEQPESHGNPSSHGMDCCGGDGLPTSAQGERGPTAPLAPAAAPVAAPGVPAALDRSVLAVSSTPSHPPERGLYTLHSSFLI